MKQPMTDIAEIFDTHLNQMQSEFETLDNRKRIFEDLRYTRFEDFSKNEYQIAYMVLNGIMLIRNIGQFKKLADIEKQFDFLFAEGNSWPVYNDKYIKEAHEEAYIDVLWLAKREIQLVKSELSTKAQYYDSKEFISLVKSFLDTYYLKIRSYEGLEYHTGEITHNYHKIFKNKLDVIVGISMSYNGYTIEGGGGEILSNPNVYHEYGYPAILIDRVQWRDFEFSSRMITILEEFLKGYNYDNTSPEAKNQRPSLDLHQKILLLNSLGALEKLPRNNDGELNKSLASKVLPFLIGHDQGNIRKTLSNLEKKPSELSAKQKNDVQEVDKLLKSLGCHLG